MLRKSSTQSFEVIRKIYLKLEVVIAYLGGKRDIFFSSISIKILPPNDIIDEFEPRQLVFDHFFDIRFILRNWSYCLLYAPQTSFLYFRILGPICSTVVFNYWAVRFPLISISLSLV